MLEGFSFRQRIVITKKSKERPEFLTLMFHYVWVLAKVKSFFTDVLKTPLLKSNKCLRLLFLASEINAKSQHSY